MGKCCQYCLYPQLPMDASQHRCANCGNKFHGLCSDVRHPRADELQLGMGNDHLCPSCARSIGAVAVHSIGSDSPYSIGSSDSSDASLLSESTQRLLLVANNKEDDVESVQHITNVVVSGSRGKKLEQLVFHPLPPGVKVTNATAIDGVKCQFSKQSTFNFRL